jgi:hypothetical protein
MHHLDPTEKEIAFGEYSSFRKADWDSGSWKGEADKCLLVCANCHFLIHAGILLVDDGISYDDESWYSGWSAA